MQIDTPARLLVAARRRAGLAQRALARRARTAQSVIARIESGSTSPSFRTLEVRAASLEDILRSKLASNRPQDQQDAITLLEMLKRRT